MIKATHSSFGVNIEITFYDISLISFVNFFIDALEFFFRMNFIK